MTEWMGFSIIVDTLSRWEFREEIKWTSQKRRKKNGAHAIERLVVEVGAHEKCINIGRSLSANVDFNSNCCPDWPPNELKSTRAFVASRNSPLKLQQQMEGRQGVHGLVNFDEILASQKKNPYVVDDGSRSTVQCYLRWIGMLKMNFPLSESFILIHRKHTKSSETVFKNSNQAHPFVLQRSDSLTFIVQTMCYFAAHSLMPSKRERCLCASAQIAHQTIWTTT